MQHLAGEELCTACELTGLKSLIKKLQLVGPKFEFERLLRKNSNSDQLDQSQFSNFIFNLLCAIVSPDLLETQKFAVPAIRRPDAGIRFSLSADLDNP